MVREPTHSLCVSHREEEVRRLWLLTQRNTTIFAQVSVYSLLGKFSVARAIKIKKKITRVIHKISLVMVLFRSMKVSWRRVGIMWKSHAAKNAGTFREIVIQLCLDAPIMSNRTIVFDTRFTRPPDLPFRSSQEKNRARSYRRKIDSLGSFGIRPFVAFVVLRSADRFAAGRNKVTRLGAREGRRWGKTGTSDEI